jgi:hypothetical protein
LGALGGGLLPSAFAGERSGFTLLVIMIVPVVLLGRGRMTRWRVAMIALGWTTSTMSLYVDSPGGLEELVFLLTLVLVAVAVFAVAVRARIARPLTIALAATCVVVGARPFVHYLTEPWLHPGGWQYHAAWWHFGRACQRGRLVITYFAPVVAAIFAFRADRSFRTIVDELRAKLARAPDAPA